ncbi:MAG TPA: hypothetical protein PKA59_05100, partial [Chakrabartia sp.]|nr:hypothetical protein [Chakrabartia sp.]
MADAPARSASHASSYRTSAGPATKRVVRKRIVRKRVAAAPAGQRRVVKRNKRTVTTTTASC